MLIVKGVNFFPKQTLLGIPGIGNNYQIIVEEVDGVNDVLVNVVAEPVATWWKRRSREHWASAPREMCLL